MKKRNKRKPVVRLFLKKYYDVVAFLLFMPAIIMIVGWAGWAETHTEFFLPHHIPMLIVSLIMMILAGGLFWIYEER